MAAWFGSPSQSAGADAGVIAPGKAVGKRERQDPVLPLARAHLIDICAHRTGGGGHGQDHPAVEIAHHRLSLALGGVFREAKQVFGPLGHIDMGVFLEADQEGGLFHHQVGQKTMRVQKPADHRIGRGGAQVGHQVALAIVIAVGDHRAVQSQQDDVGPARGPEVVDDLVAKAFVDRFHGQSGGLGMGRQGFNHVPAQTLGIVAPDMQRAGPVHRRVFGGVSVMDRAIFKAEHPGGQRRKGIGFGAETGNEQFH